MNERRLVMMMMMMMMGVEVEVEDRKFARTLGIIIICFCLLFRITLQQTVPLQSRAERVSLIQLRSSLGLRSRDWPIKAEPCLNWTGVRCRNGRVVEINVSGFKRTRIGSQNPQFSVDALANFTLLESFNASKFLLPGPIPVWFGLRVSLSLKVLDLRSSSVTGSIPISLGNFTNLTTLYLSHNNLIGTIPSTLGQLSSLSVLDLSNNFLSGIISPAIGILSNLQLLNLSNNSLSSSIPPQMGDLRSLVDLDLSFNSLSGSLTEDLKGLRNLTRLDIKNNSVSGLLPSDLFSALSGLQFLVLSNNRFSGNLPDLLWSTMPELVFLDVSGNNLTGMLPNVTSNMNVSRPSAMNFSFNRFYGVLTSALVRFDSIDLTGNYFQGRVPGYVTKNGSLSGNCLTVVPNQRSLTDCSTFYTALGLDFDNFGLPTAPAPSSGRKSNRWIILAGVLGGFGIIVLVAIIFLIIFCITRKKRAAQSTNPRGTGVEPIPAVEAAPSPPSVLNVGEVFTYEQILQATDSFSDVNLVKNGHSGDLFKGINGNRIAIVIKRIDLLNAVASRKEAYKIELDFFSKVSHTRLVPFLGHCLENEDNKFLVYKFMPNSDLSSAFYWKTNSDDDSLQSLDWITRLKIAIGAAEGLSYLHHECTPPLVHRDVQASSILLDDKFEVRLGSLSSVCPQESEIHQSMITRFLRLPSSSSETTSGSPTATCAYDVYCFGKVLLELVTGKLGRNALSESETKEWLEATLPYISIYEKELVTSIVDPSLIIDEDLLEEVWAMAIVARSCLNPKPSRRPLMRYILKALENPLKVVREENNNVSSARLRTTSSRGSWNAALFGSWRASDVGGNPIVPKIEGGGSSFKQSGTSASQGSGNNGVGDRSSSTRRQSKDIFPEPLDVEDPNR